MIVRAFVRARVCGCVCVCVCVYVCVFTSMCVCARASRGVREVCVCVFFFFSLSLSFFPATTLKETKPPSNLATASFLSIARFSCPPALPNTQGFSQASSKKTQQRERESAIPFLPFSCGPSMPPRPSFSIDSIPGQDALESHIWPQIACPTERPPFGPCKRCCQRQRHWAHAMGPWARCSS